MTIGELLKSSLRLIGAIAPGETPSADEMADALTALNVMLKGWSTKRLLINATTLENFPLITGTTAYTIGTGGTFNTARPTKILSAFVRSSGIDYPVEVYAERRRYDEHPDKTATGMPCELLYVPSYALGYVYPYPVPDQAYTIFLELLKPLSELSGYVSEISLPAEYLRALKYNLAIELAPEYGATPSMDVYGVAKESMADVKRMNLPEVTVDLTKEIQSNSYMNIYRGY